MEYKKVTGTQKDKPLALEVNADTVYLRKNIERKLGLKIFGKSQDFWEYDEMQLTFKEFALMKAMEVSNE